MGPHWPEFCPPQQHKMSLFSLLPDSSLTSLKKWIGLSLEELILDILFWVQFKLLIVLFLLSGVVNGR